MRALLAVAVAVGGVLGVGELADLTQNRPDPVVEGSVTVVVFDVGTRRYNGTDDEAAAALWAVCAASVSGTATGPVATTDGTYRVEISPAIGTNGRKRLTGCLEDSTLDRVQGHVESVTAG
ncbi:MAG TPA: hypothetical protein VKZ72_06075 [Acidimicrobiales bacterium]|nr:hypothetical protein [Acidimicrobiales bacterium]